MWAIFQKKSAFYFRTIDCRKTSSLVCLSLLARLVCMGLGLEPCVKMKLSHVEHFSNIVKNEARKKLLPCLWQVAWCGGKKKNFNLKLVFMLEQFFTPSLKELLKRPSIQICLISLSERRKRRKQNLILEILLWHKSLCAREIYTRNGKR